jgi:hypothetical protein
MANSKIEAELLKVSDLETKKKETRQDYLERLMLTVAKVPDQVWTDLSQEAKDWNDEAAEAYNAGMEIGDFPDFEEEEELDDFEATQQVDDETGEVTEVKAEEAAEAEDMQPEGKRRGRPPGPKVDHKAAIKEFGPPRRSSAKRVSACHIVKKMVVRRPTISVNEILDKLKENNLKVSPVTVATLRSSIRDTLRVVNEEGVGQFQL